MPEGRDEVKTVLKEGLEVRRQAAGAHLAKRLPEEVCRPAELAERDEIQLGNFGDGDPSINRQRARQDVSRNPEALGASFQKRELGRGKMNRKSPSSPFLGRERGTSGSWPRRAAGSLRHKGRLNGKGVPLGNRGNVWELEGKNPGAREQRELVHPPRQSNAMKAAQRCEPTRLRVAHNMAGYSPGGHRCRESGRKRRPRRG